MTIYTDMNDVPFAVLCDNETAQGKLGAMIRVQPSDDHEFTIHKITKIEAWREGIRTEEWTEGKSLVRLSAPLSDHARLS